MSDTWGGKMRKNIRKKTRLTIIILAASILALFICAFNVVDRQIWGGVAFAEAIPCPMFTSPPGSCNQEYYIDAETLKKKVCDYKNSSSLYKKEKVKSKDFTDCWGMLITALRRTKVDTKVPDSGQAYQAPKYFSKNTDKYEVIKGIKSTKKLMPGDMLFSTKSSNSHASMFVGSKYCGCKGGVISASLGGHGPKCSSWTKKMTTVVRLKPAVGQLVESPSDDEIQELLAMAKLSDFEEGN